jgi:hypothetical protein
LNEAETFGVFTDLGQQGRHAGVARGVDVARVRRDDHRVAVQAVRIERDTADPASDPGFSELRPLVPPFEMGRTPLPASDPGVTVATGTESAKAERRSHGDLARISPQWAHRTAARRRR